ncbi:hypothetical protein OIU85_007411 [Salix viminalis]|uniref:Uncharacterized protein n=1 Tax=Salix viminalis TaxID=40686 RepID=A0A9Q0SNP2_SALVM|nr:hypothetical protein OIU85_007411 [Salix viminalis]
MAPSSLPSPFPNPAFVPNPHRSEQNSPRFVPDLFAFASYACSPVPLCAAPVFFFSLFALAPPTTCSPACCLPLRRPSSQPVFLHRSSSSAASLKSHLSAQPSARLAPCSSTEAALCLALCRLRNPFCPGRSHDQEESKEKVHPLLPSQISREGYSRASVSSSSDHQSSSLEDLSGAEDSVDDDSSSSESESNSHYHKDAKYAVQPAAHHTE